MRLTTIWTLPAMTLGVYVSGVLGRFLRASLIGEARADYVRTARAKGVPENRVVGLHIMRNALLPFVTIVGLMMANQISLLQYPAAASHAVVLLALVLLIVAGILRAVDIRKEL